MQYRYRLGTMVAASAMLAVSLAAQQDDPPSVAQEKPVTEIKAPDLPEPVDPRTYRIGPDDVMAIDVWNQPQLSGPTVVRADGMLTARLLGEIQVNGMTPNELAQKLTEEYSKLVVEPRIQVYVQQVRSKKYMITGDGAARTGAFPLVVPTRVLEALIKAGGFNEWANKKRITILRGDKPYHFNYNDYVKGKNQDKNIYLENGDLIIVN